MNFSGKLYNVGAVRRRRRDRRIDYDQVAALAREHKPKHDRRRVLAPIRAIIDLQRFREIADKVGAYLLVDMAHIAGLVAAGLYPEPGAARRFRHHHHAQDAARSARRHDPRARERRDREELNSAVFPGIQGGPLMHVIAAKAVCFNEALQPGVQGLPATGRRQRAAHGAACSSSAATTSSPAAPTIT